MGNGHQDPQRGSSSPQDLEFYHHSLLLFTSNHTDQSDLVSIHGHPLRAPAQLSVSCWADGSAPGQACTAFLECQQLLSSECFVVDLAGGFDQVLEMGTSEEVSKIDEFGVVLIFDVDDAPLVLSSADLLAVNNDCLLAAHHSKWDDILDSRVCGSFLVIQLFVVIWIHLQVVEGKLLLDALLERTAFLKGERVRLGDDRNHVDHIRQFLENDNVNGFEGVAGRLNEEEAAVNASVLDVSFSLSGQFFPQIGRMLIFDVFDDGVPAEEY